MPSERMGVAQLTGDIVVGRITVVPLIGKRNAWALRGRMTASSEGRRVTLVHSEVMAEVETISGAR